MSCSIDIGSFDPALLALSQNPAGLYYTAWQSPKLDRRDRCYYVNNTNNRRGRCRTALPQRQLQVPFRAVSHCAIETLILLTLRARLPVGSWPCVLMSAATAGWPVLQPVAVAKPISAVFIGYT